MHENGYLALVLHAHLPFVRHPEHDPFLEEDWLYEAITETYLPLLAMLDGLLRDGVDACLSLTLTPPLCHMLRDALLMGRYDAHLDRLIELARRSRSARGIWGRRLAD
jgi:1,4-alpha-glucan branching enzyme